MALSVRVRWFMLGFLVLGPAVEAVQAGPATVREYRTVIRTYPFSDPDPIPAPGRIYPYFRFDGYTDRPVDREWTVVELENDYLRVTVLPEIGGKIWSAVEKATGRSFIYDNHVVKFRDIAMRGPWTSGGIEANYGIIGHTPNCATPVDYETSHGAFGARVVIGVLDLLTRTPWRLEITLPTDAAYFTTRSIWHNPTPIEQPYYTWMNAGIKAGGRLELIYPGTHHIGHGGEVAPWPIDPATGRNLALYEQNDFGSYKSYHVVGRRTDFFGAYWHDDEFGMARYAVRDDKPGKKAWIWGLSRQGMIWESLLTDTDGQYVEVQSGRLFNQAAEASTQTPFKHRGFEPHTADTWTEYWFPVKGTGGFVDATPRVALNVRRPNGDPAQGGRLASTEIRLSAVARIDDTIEVLDGETVVFSAPLHLAPAATWKQPLPVAIPPGRARVRIGTWYDYREADDTALARPLEAPADFDWTTAQGLWLAGKAWLRQREYTRAEASLTACLTKDPHYLAALADLAMLRYRALDYQGAWDLARRGLAIDTYDPASNYYYGLAAVRLGRIEDAIDGFEIASASPAYRSAAYTELAKVRVRQGRLVPAQDDVVRSLRSGPDNLEARHLEVLMARLRGDGAEAADRLAREVPLSHFARAERYLASGSVQDRRGLVEGIRNEMPHETFLELAVWYHDLGRVEDARRLLALSPQNAEVLYWRAFLDAAVGDAMAAEALREADAASVRLVFPFRAESAPVFAWAVTATRNWRPKYFLALITWSRGDVSAARDLLQSCGAAPDFAPFYAARARAFEEVGPNRALVDLERAAALDPTEWRFGRAIVEHHLRGGRTAEAAAVARRYRERFPSSYVLGMLYARALLLDGRPQDAAPVIDGLAVLPFEGSTSGRALHREAQLRLAASAAGAGRYRDALARIEVAREWPERLGAGEPYAADLDERLEDWMTAECLDRLGQSAEAMGARERVVASQKPVVGAAALVVARCLTILGRGQDADRIVAAWAAREGHADVAEWGRRFVAGSGGAWPAAAATTDDLRILADFHRLVPRR